MKVVIIQTGEYQYPLNQKWFGLFSIIYNNYIFKLIYLSYQNISIYQKWLIIN